MKGAETMSGQYHVKLEVFEGPLDLLLHLIRKNRVDIYDIPIALVMEQYLEYLSMMRSLNIDVAAEFLEMAATLAYIKSRMLVPRQSLREDGADEEDPRLELVRPLLEYARIKEAAEALASRPQLDRDVYVRHGPAADLPGLEGGEEIAEVGLFELIAALQRVLRTTEPEPILELRPDSIRLKDRIAQLLHLLAGVSSITFEELFASQPEKSEIVTTFLALLELIRLQLVRAFQHDGSGVIRLYLAAETGTAGRREGQ